jgi:hypothetical protein
MSPGVWSMRILPAANTLTQHGQSDTLTAGLAIAVLHPQPIRLPEDAYDDHHCNLPLRCSLEPHLLSSLNCLQVSVLRKLGGSRQVGARNRPSS